MKLTGLAKRLRDDSTNAERLFWSRVRGHRFLGYKFKRQQPIGNYIVDFVCFEARLVVELDGGPHAGDLNDQLRDNWLRSQKFRVLRFWNNEVLTNIDGIIEMVLTHLSPSPIKGEGAILLKEDR